MSELAGALRERVAVERFVGVPDGAGGTSGDGVALANLWAAVGHDGFGPAAEGERVSRAPRYRVTIRQWSDVEIGDRLRWHGAALRVLSVARDPRRPECVEMVTEETRA